MIETCVFSDEISTDFEEAVRVCAELRVRYVEPRGLWGTDINRIDLDGAKRMKTVLDRYGVKVGVIGSGVGKCDLGDDGEWKNHMEILRRQIGFCELFGTRTIRCFPFYVPNPHDWNRSPRPKLSDHLDCITEKMRPAVRLAEQEGVVLAIETEPATFSGSCEETAAIVDAAGSRALTVCWDVANSWHFGEPAFPEGYERIRGRITHLHIKDITIDPANRAKPTGVTHIDCGDVPYPEIFRALIADGYDGLASVETHLFSGMADRFRWLKPATESAMRNLNRVLAEAQGRF